MEVIIDKIVYLLRCKIFEENFLRCQSYRKNSIIKWKQQTGFSWKTTIKILKRIEIFDSIRIRQIIKELIGKNEDIFSKNNLFITSFGAEGKSGGKIAYEFRHTKLIKQNQFIESWRINSLPEDSTIIFVDDLIGTGKQAKTYILEQLNLLINPSNNPLLLTVCATREGAAKVSSETNFDVIYGVELQERTWQYYSSQNNYFSQSEKKEIISLNAKLKKQGRADFDRGLLVVFHYSTPNNTMPIIWKDGYEYKDATDNSQKWQALFPREY